MTKISVSCSLDGATLPDGSGETLKCRFFVYSLSVMCSSSRKRRRRRLRGHYNMNGPQNPVYRVYAVVRRRNGKLKVGHPAKPDGRYKFKTMRRIFGKCWVGLSGAGFNTRASRMRIANATTLETRLRLLRRAASRR